MGISWRKYQQMKWANKVQDYIKKYQKNRFLRKLQSDMQEGSSKTYSRMKHHLMKLFGMEVPG